MEFTELDMTGLKGSISLIWEDPTGHRAIKPCTQLLSWSSAIRETTKNENLRIE